jgi:hypothetical protein
MQTSLNNYEIRHLLNKNIRNYPNPWEKKPEPAPLPPAAPKPHPFLYNPAEDVERFKPYVDNLKQPSELDMQ